MRGETIGDIRFVYDPELPVQQQFCHTLDTARIQELLLLFVAARRPVMIVGGSGSGKTVLIRRALSQLPAHTTWRYTSLNYFTDANSMQVR